MYSISGYGEMIGDTVRMSAYEEALRRSVKPGSVVVDIGTGTGIMAILACRFGARRVYAIEPDDVIQVARQIAADNGFSDRIEFIQDISTQVELPEPADVIVSDLRGVLPFFRHHLEAIVDARQRLLAPGGTLIPGRDRVWATLVEMPEAYQTRVRPWGDNHYGFNLGAATRFLTNSWTKQIAREEQILVEPQCCSTLDYYTADSLNSNCSLTWTASRPGVAHGLCVWFDTDLIEGVGFSNAPGGTQAIYGNAFFPWSEPIEISPGDTILVGLHADLVGEDYIWRWSISVRDSEQAAPRVRMEQSTFFGIPLSPAHLRKRAGGYVPRLNDDGLIDSSILQSMNGDVSLNEIAGSVLEKFPKRFKTLKDALTHVGELSKKYSG